MIFRYLDTVGDGSGTKNANVNGVVTPVPFLITNPVGSKDVYKLSRLLVQIRDNANFDAEDYGGVATLANGLDVVAHRGDAAEDLLDGLPIQSSADWGRQCFDAVYSDYGVGDNYLLVRWTFAKTGSDLVLQPGDSLVVTVNDDLSTLVSHYFQVQGTSPFSDN